MNKSEQDDKVVGTWPNITEREWYFLAIVISLFTIVAAIISFIWIFSEPHLNNRSKMVSILAPFGTLPLAMITFSTVAWRGKVTERQADQQRRQNDATDDANFAKLLQEGAKLLGDDKLPNKLAGIASLKILLTEPKARYAQEAIDVLAEGLKSLFTSPIDYGTLATVTSSSTYSSIQQLLIREVENGKFSSVNISLTAVENWQQFYYWPQLTGFNNCEFRGGNITRAELYFDQNKTAAFVDCRISNSACKVEWPRYQRCNFDGCKIIYFEDYSFLSEDQSFFKCDFSGCEFSPGVSANSLKDSNLAGCWFDVENPPNLELTHAFLEYLEPRMKIGNRWVKISEIGSKNAVLNNEKRNLVAYYQSLF